MPDGSATPKTPPKSAPAEVKRPPSGPPAFTRPPGPPDHPPNESAPSGSTAKAIAPGPKADLGKGKGKASFGKAGPKAGRPPHRNNRGPSQQAREGRQWKESLTKATAAVHAEKESMEVARDQAYTSLAVSNATILSLTQSRDRANAVIQQMTESNNRALQEHGNRVHQLWSMYNDQLQVQRDEQNEAFEFQKKQFDEELAEKQKKIDSLEKALLDKEAKTIDARVRKIESLERSLLEQQAEWANKLAASSRSLMQSEKEVARVREVARSQIETLQKRIIDLTAEVERLTALLNKMKKAEVKVEQKGPSSGSNAKLKEDQSSSSLSSTSPARKVGPKGSASKAGDDVSGSDFTFHCCLLRLL